MIRIPRDSGCLPRITSRSKHMIRRSKLNLKANGMVGSSEDFNTEISNSTKNIETKERSLHQTSNRHLWIIFHKSLFFLLPFFALLLKLLYVRRNYYYSEHLVLSICYYNFFYLAASLVMLINLIPGLRFCKRDYRVLDLSYISFSP